MGEGVGGGGLDGFAGFGPSYTPGQFNALFDPFNPATRSGRTAINCGLTDPEVQRAIDRGDPFLLFNYARTYLGGPDACGYVPRIIRRLAELPPEVLVPALAQLRAQQGSYYTVGFIDSLVGGIGAIGSAIGSGIGAIASNLPQIANTLAAGAGAIQAIQGRLSGMPTAVVVNPATGTPVAVPVGAMPTTMTMAQMAQAEFAAACNADPTGQCQAAIRAALAGGTGMTMPIDPSTGTPIAMAGALSGLGGLARSALMNPSVIAALRAVGLGGLIGAGEAGVSALLSAAGGGSAGVRGPLLMDWPAGTSYPRGIVLRAPDKPEKRYRSAGAPLLLSGDIAAVRRVRKAAGRAGRGRRRSRAPQVLALGPGVRNVCGSCLSAPCGCSK